MLEIEIQNLNGKFYNLEKNSHRSSAKKDFESGDEDEETKSFNQSELNDEQISVSSPLPDLWKD